jgi:hypothetical protein
MEMNFYYREHNNSPFESIPSHMNPVHTLRQCSVNIHFDVTFTSIAESSKVVFSFHFIRLKFLVYFPRLADVIEFDLVTLNTSGIEQNLRSSCLFNCLHSVLNTFI